MVEKHCPRDTLAHMHQKTCIRMFTAALLITAEIRKQVKEPSTEEWMNKLVYSSTDEELKGMNPSTINKKE